MLQSTPDWSYFGSLTLEQIVEEAKYAPNKNTKWFQDAYAWLYSRIGNRLGDVSMPKPLSNHQQGPLFHFVPVLATNTIGGTLGFIIVTKSQRMVNLIIRRHGKDTVTPQQKMFLICFGF